MRALGVKNIKEIEDLLDEEDRELLFSFARTLLQTEKYQRLRKELQKRRDEVRRKETLTHDEFWREI